MKRALLFFLLIAPATALACSSSSSPGADIDSGSDASTPDAAIVDSAAADASADAEALVNGCSEADFAANDHSAANDPRIIQAPNDATPAQFTPHCMRVKINQVVTWQGDLADLPVSYVVHSDAASTGDAGVVATVGLPDGSPDQDTATLQFSGTIAFSCAADSATMFGAVEFVP